MVNGNRLAPTFRYSLDAGASWQLGALSEAAEAATPPDGGDQIESVAVSTVGGQPRWLAVGSGEQRRLTWTSADGRTWDRHLVPDEQLDTERDSVNDLVAVPEGFAIVGDRDDGTSRPTAWTSRDGIAWSAHRLGGSGTASAVAARGSTLVAVGSVEKKGTDSYASWTSNDRGRSWRAGSSLPVPSDDSDFSRRFDDIAATEEGFGAVGSYHAEDWQPSLHGSRNGRSWRLTAAGDTLAKVANSGGSLIVASGPRQLVVTQEYEPRSQPRIWVPQGGGWRSADRTPLDQHPERVTGYSWLVVSVARTGAAWIAVASREDNGRVVSEIWRSTDDGRTFSRVPIPVPQLNQPTVNPWRLIRTGDQVLAFGESRRRPVVWRRAGSGSFEAPSMLSDSPADAVHGAAAGDGAVLAYGTRTVDGDQVGIVWRQQGRRWVATGDGMFSEADNPYASSEITDVVRWRKQWVAVGTTTRNGGLNASALAASLTDGKSWRRGRGARTYAKEGGDVWYDVTDLEGDHDRTRRISAVAVAGDRLLAVGSSSEGAEDRATMWTSTDPKRWSMTRLPGDGLAWSRMSEVAVRGSVVVAIGTGAANEGDPERLVVWTSADSGRSWRQQPLDTGLDSEVSSLLATEDGFALLSARTDKTSHPALLVSGDGRTWSERPFDALPVVESVGAFPLDAAAAGEDLLVLVRVTAESGGATRLVVQRSR